MLGRGGIFRSEAVVISLLTKLLAHTCLLIVSFTRPQVNESDADDQDFGDYALDFMAGEYV